MSTITPTILNSAPFLRNSRHFPPDLSHLVLEVNKSYIDTANAVNKRTISIFPTTQSIVNGEFWFVGPNSPQQGIRQVYQFTNSTLTFNHNINVNSITNFVRIWGTFFDGTNWQTLPYVDVVNANNQINVKINSTQVVITKGAGSPPTINNGTLILEWISNP